MLLLSIFALNTIECNQISTQQSVSEAPQQKTTVQEITQVLSKTIDFTLLFGTASGLIAAVIIRCNEDYPTNENMQDSFQGSLLASTLCATAYFIKNKCI